MNDYQARKINQVKSQLKSAEIHLALVGDDVADLLATYLPDSLEGDADAKQMVKYLKNISKALNTLRAASEGR